MSPPPSESSYGLLLDMDGVLVDFVGAALRLHGRDEVLDNWPDGVWDMSEVLGISGREFWHPINQAGAEFWASLEPYTWCDELVALADETGGWCILTSPSSDPSCAAGKITWLQRRFGGGFRGFLIGPPKWVCARPDQVLVDDNDTNVDHFRARGGQAILFPRPWNRNHLLSADPMGHVREALAEIVAT